MRDLFYSMAETSFYELYIICSSQCLLKFTITWDFCWKLFSWFEFVERLTQLLHDSHAFYRLTALVLMNNLRIITMHKYMYILLAKFINIACIVCTVFLFICGLNVIYNVLYCVKLVKTGMGKPKWTWMLLKTRSTLILFTPLFYDLCYLKWPMLVIFFNMCPLYFGYNIYTYDGSLTANIISINQNSQMMMMMLLHVGHRKHH